MRAGTVITTWRPVLGDARRRVGRQEADGITGGGQETIS